LSRGTTLKKMKNYEPDLERLPSLPTPSPETLADPASLFLHLTAWTVPHGGEDRYYGDMLKELGFTRDGCGNWFQEIETAIEGVRAETCFAAHLDTCDWDAEPIVRHVNDSICTTDGKTILGADDRTGVAILLYLANRDVPGLYYLFIGEEKGCVGSSMAAARGYLGDSGAKIKRVVSFDRKGKTSVITHQCSRRTCSDEFALALSNALNEYGLQYGPDDGGVFTDSREFADAVPECTNLSVGYYDMHSFKERQDLAFLSYLCQVCAQIDWEALPTERNPNLPDEDDYFGYDDGRSYYTGKYADWSWGDKEHERYDLAYDAVSECVDNFIAGLPADEEAIGRLVLNKKADTVDMIVTLIDELERWVRGRGDE
jgi:hypothetical protein